MVQLRSPQVNKRPRLGKSDIEYLDYVWNFYSGCRHWESGICAVGLNCWAKKITERFNNHYPNGFEPTLYPEALESPLYLKKPSLIGVCFMGDLFGDWVDPFHHGDGEYGEDEAGYVTLKGRVFETIERCPQHTFLFLTKCPKNLAAWSLFPSNAWVGATATDYWKYVDACHYLSMVEASVKFLSLEPLLSWDKEASYFFQSGAINWLIIGAQTKPTVFPEIAWVREIVEAADRAGVKVFQKDNLRPLLGDNLRQEMPR